MYVCMGVQHGRGTPDCAAQLMKHRPRTSYVHHIRRNKTPDIQTKRLRRQVYSSICIFNACQRNLHTGARAQQASREETNRLLRHVTFSSLFASTASTFLSRSLTHALRLLQPARDMPSTTSCKHQTPNTQSAKQHLARTCIIVHDDKRKKSKRTDKSTEKGEYV